MGLMDVFKASKNKALASEVERLSSENQHMQEKIAELESMLTPEMKKAIDISEEIKRLELVKQQKLDDISVQETDIEKKKEIILDLKCEIANKKAQCHSLDEVILLESFGIYTPTYDFAKSDQYKERLDRVRARQKEMIKANTAALGSTTWTVNGSASQGQKMVKDMQKLLLRAFNSECDELIEKVKYNNFEASVKRIHSSCDAISKLGNMMSISISNAYREAKIEELTLAFEYACKKQEEKEAAKEECARLREQAKLQKEIEEARKKLEKEREHYMSALKIITKQLESADGEMREELLAKQAEIQEHISDNDIAMKDVDYREANQRAGYVYVISNIGAFGENVYKIGMTRRLDPQERVDELGDASVPFGFDVHAMIFSDDAPKLEAALHKAFESKKVNMINHRREFFNVTLAEIKEVIRQNYDKTVEFIDYPEADQWRASVKMKSV